MSHTGSIGSAMAAAGVDWAMVLWTLVKRAYGIGSPERLLLIILIKRAPSGPVRTENLGGLNCQHRTPPWHRCSMV